MPVASNSPDEGASSRIEPEILAPIVGNGSLADVGAVDVTERRAPAHDRILDGDCEGVSVIHYWRTQMGDPSRL